MNEDELELHRPGFAEGYFTWVTLPSLADPV